MEAITFEITMHSLEYMYTVSFFMIEALTAIVIFKYNLGAKIFS